MFDRGVLVQRVAQLGAFVSLKDVFTDAEVRGVMSPMLRRASCRGLGLQGNAGF